MPDSKRCIEILRSPSGRKFQCRNVRGHGQGGDFCSKHAQMYKSIEAALRVIAKTAPRERLKKEEVKLMCGENEPDIAVFRFDNDGMGGPTQDTIEGVLDDIRSELENWGIDDKPITLTITTARMSRKKYDALPEFEGY